MLSGQLDMRWFIKGRCHNFESSEDGILKLVGIGWLAAPYPSLSIYGYPCMDQGSDQGPRIKDDGPCFGTNEHPRRDTDVILRLSKSTIKDLSF